MLNSSYENIGLNLKFERAYVLVKESTNKCFGYSQQQDEINLIYLEHACLIDHNSRLLI